MTIDKLLRDLEEEYGNIRLKHDVDMKCEQVNRGARLTKYNITLEKIKSNINVRNEVMWETSIIKHVMVDILLDEWSDIKYRYSKALLEIIGNK